MQPPMKNNSSDEFQTPKEGFEILEPYIKKESIIWECAYGGGELGKDYGE